MATKAKVKAPVKKIAIKKPDPAKVAAKEQEKALASWDKKRPVLMKKYPNLVENDFHQYQGESLDSVQRRVAERAGVSVQELIS